MIARIVFEIFIKLACDGSSFGIMTCYGVALRINPINCVNMASDQFCTNSVLGGRVLPSKFRLFA